MLSLHLDIGGGQTVWLPALAGVGLVVGYIAGMFGVGGGFLLTPVLIYLFDVPVPMAVGSALCQQCGTSLASFLKYRYLRRGEPRIDLVMVGGSVLGVHVGTQLLAYLYGLGSIHIGAATAPAANVVLDVLFILLLSGTSLYTLHDVRRAYARGVERGDQTIPGPFTRLRVPPYIELPNVHLEAVSVPVLAYLALLLGIASGLMGIGGGVLFMPVMLYGFGLSVRNAAGTGVLLLFVTVAVGTFEQAMRGFVSLPLAMAILVGSSIGTQLGALTTHYLRNRVLRLIFGVLVLATTGMIVWDLVRLLG